MASRDKIETEGRSHYSLLSYDNIPLWYQNNDSIRHGYRSVMNDSKACIESLMYFHNETANIYTHLFPAFLAILGQGVLYQYLSLYYPRATMTDYSILALHLGCTSICLGLSAFYHTFLCHSAHSAELWSRIDYMGIVALTCGDAVSGVYVAFYCEPVLQGIYWTMIGTLGALSLYIVIHASCQSRQYRSFRLSVFITWVFGVCASHSCMENVSHEQLKEQSGLPFYYTEGGLLLLGALLYITRFPEKGYPGRFDMWGNSHQLLHVLVVVATFLHFLGILNAFQWNQEHRRCNIGHSGIAVPVAHVVAEHLSTKM